MEIQPSTEKVEEMACNFPASRGRYSILVPRVFSINPEIEEKNIHGHLKFLWTVLFKLSVFKSDDICALSNCKLFSFNL